MKSKTILLVEDNAQDELLMLRVLRKNNLAREVVVMRDGQQAIDYLFQQGEFAQRGSVSLPGVVLLDIGLPRLSGLEVLQRVRADARTRWLPVVMLTSSNVARDRLQSYLHGANSYVRKPIDFAEFSDTVARLGVYWLAINESAEGGPA